MEDLQQLNEAQKNARGGSFFRRRNSSNPAIRPLLDMLAAASTTIISRSSLHLPRPSVSDGDPRFPQSPLPSRRGGGNAGLRCVGKSGVKYVPRAILASISGTNSRSPVGAERNDDPIVVIDNYDSSTYNLCQERLVILPPYGVVHGKSSLVYYDEKGEDGLFAGLSNPFTAGRYHSLVIEKESFPHGELEVTAWTEDGLIMAARHKKYMRLQSIVTSEGKTMVGKVIERYEAKTRI